MINRRCRNSSAFTFRILSFSVAEELLLRLLVSGIAAEDLETVSIIYIVVARYMNFRQTIKRSLGRVTVNNRVNSVDSDLRST